MKNEGTGVRGQGVGANCVRPRVRQMPAERADEGIGPYILRPAPGETVGALHEAPAARALSPVPCPPQILP